MLKKGRWLRGLGTTLWLTPQRWWSSESSGATRTGSRPGPSSSRASGTRKFAFRDRKSATREYFLSTKSVSRSLIFRPKTWRIFGFEVRSWDWLWKIFGFFGTKKRWEELTRPQTQVGSNLPKYNKWNVQFSDTCLVKFLFCQKKRETNTNFLIFKIQWHN